MDAVYAAMPNGMHRHTKHIALPRAMSEPENEYSPKFKKL